MFLTSLAPLTPPEFHPLVQDDLGLVAPPDPGLESNPFSKVLSTSSRPQAKTSTALFSIPAADGDTESLQSRKLYTIPASGPN